MNQATKTPPTLDDLRQKREEILQIAARNKAKHVRVFGSVARGSASDGSDIDFLVTFEDGASLYELSGIVVELQDLLGCEVDVADDQTRDTAFLQRVAKEAILI
ncbi:MAG: nucleotidyltransferase [Anaerolineaceae bacterium]|nr:nucleotidyltransferase [Anaerolineaceae bacterium]